MRLGSHQQTLCPPVAWLVASEAETWFCLAPKLSIYSQNQPHNRTEICSGGGSDWQTSGKLPPGTCKPRFALQQVLFGLRPCPSLSPNNVAKIHLS